MISGFVLFQRERSLHQVLQDEGVQRMWFIFHGLTLQFRGQPCSPKWNALESRSFSYICDLPTVILHCRGR